MKFLEISEPIYLDDLIKVEDELEVKFSNEFKEHYLEYNGGYPEKDQYPWNYNETTTINTFFSIKYKGFVNLESAYKDLAILEQYLPEKIMPFADDDGGNFFCVSFRDVDYNHVYYCNNDHYNVIDNEEEYLTLLRNSFGEFLECLI